MLGSNDDNRNEEQCGCREVFSLKDIASIGTTVFALNLALCDFRGRMRRAVIWRDVGGRRAEKRA